MHKTFPGAKIIHDKRRQSAGWTVADVVLHLAQSEEAVTATVTRVRTGLGAVARGTTDEHTGEAVRRERSAPQEVFCRWRQAARPRGAVPAGFQVASGDQRCAATPVRRGPRLANRRLADRQPEPQNRAGKLVPAVGGASAGAWAAGRRPPERRSLASQGEKPADIRPAGRNHALY